MSTAPVTSTEVDGPEPLVVRAARPRASLEARRREFELDPEDRQQLLAIRLLLRLLVTWPDAPHVDGLEEVLIDDPRSDVQGPHLRYGRIRLASRQEVLHSAVADPEADDEQLSKAIEVRRALRRILEVDLGGLQYAFPVQRGPDALDLDVIDPDVDLVTLAREAHRLLGQDPAQARKELFPLLVAVERKTHAVFRSTQLDVHPHLAPFVKPLRRLHRDVLRHIIRTGVYVDEPGDVERAGNRLGLHGQDAFNTATAMAFMQEAMSRGPTVLADRYRALTDAVGGEERVPEPVDAWMGRIRRERGLQNVAIRPGDLRTGQVCRVHEATWPALGVHRADTELCGADGLPSYVRRPEHDAIVAACRQTLEEERFALIAVGGPSASGKTRLLYEVLREVGHDLWVIAPEPRRARHVHRPASHARLAGAWPVVLWLDDLELFVADEAAGLSAADLIDLTTTGTPPVLVLCTYGGHFRDLCVQDRLRTAEARAHARPGDRAGTPWGAPRPRRNGCGMRALSRSGGRDPGLRAWPGIDLGVAARASLPQRLQRAR